METVKNKMKAFFADENGAETVEWVMIASVLAALITALLWTQLQTALNGTLTSVSNQVTSAGTGT